MFDIYCGLFLKWYTLRVYHTLNQIVISRLYLLLDLTEVIDNEKNFGETYVMFQINIFWFVHSEELTDYNLTQLISRYACLSPKESKCSKWQDGNFTNNLTLLILFIL